MAKPRSVVRGPFVDGRPVPLPSASAIAAPLERTVTIGDQLYCGRCNELLANPFAVCRCLQPAAPPEPAIQPFVTEQVGLDTVRQVWGTPAPPADPSLPDHLRQVVRTELGKLAGMRRFLSDDRLLERSRALAQAWADAATLEQVR